MELPSAAWHAAQTPPTMASPLATSGFGALGAGSAAKTEPTIKTDAKVAIKNLVIDFMDDIRNSGHQTTGFYNACLRHF
jgi:hypothetical protein